MTTNQTIAVSVATPVAVLVSLFVWFAMGQLGVQKQIRAFCTDDLVDTPRTEFERRAAQADLRTGNVASVKVTSQD